MVHRVAASVSSLVAGLVPRSRDERLDRWVVLGIVAFGAYVFLLSLGHAPLRKWDEAIYANAARNMVQHGAWVVPHLYFHPHSTEVTFQPFLEKPPLVFWMQAVSMSLFGVTRFAARLPVALTAIISGLLVYRFGTCLYDRTAGLTATVVLFTTPLIYAGDHGGRTANTDVPLLLFGSLFVYLSWLALTEDREELLPVVGVTAALALLTKGFSAGIFVVAIAPLAVTKVRTLLTRAGAGMVGVTAAISLPWPLYAWSQHGHIFVEQIFLQQVLQRATGSGLAEFGGTLFPWMRFPYFAAFPGQFGVWQFLLFPAILLAVVRGREDRELHIPLFLCWWAASTFAIFVLTGNHGWYVMPMFVPCALLIGGAVSGVADRHLSTIAVLGLGTVAMVAHDGLTLAAGGVIVGLCLVTAFGVLREVGAHLRGPAFIRGASRPAPVLAAGVVVVMVVGPFPFGAGAPVYDAEERLGMTVGAEMADGETLALGPKVKNLFVFSFYVQQPLERKTVTELEGDPFIEYAVVTDETASQVSREHTTVGGWNNVRVIRFSS